MTGPGAIDEKHAGAGPLAAAAAFMAAANPLAGAPGKLTIGPAVGDGVHNGVLWVMDTTRRAPAVGVGVDGIALSCVGCVDVDAINALCTKPCG